MPRTKKERRTMCAAAHDAGFARKMGIPQPVGRKMCTAPMEPRGKKGPAQKGKKKH